MFARALTDLDRSQDVLPVSIDCAGRETWQHGNSLINYMKMVSTMQSVKRSRFFAVQVHVQVHLSKSELVHVHIQISQK